LRKIRTNPIVRWLARLFLLVILVSGCAKTKTNVVLPCAPGDVFEVQKSVLYTRTEEDMKLLLDRHLTVNQLLNRGGGLMQLNRKFRVLEPHDFVTECELPNQDGDKFTPRGNVFILTREFATPHLHKVM
jgi:hypothetical protein